MKRIIIAAVVLAALGVAIYGGIKLHRKHTVKAAVNNSLKQVFGSEGGQDKALNDLRKMGPKAVPDTIQELAQPGDIGSAAELSLLNNPNTKNFLPDLISMLESKNPDAREHAASLVMDQIANDRIALDVSVLPVLIRTLNDTNEYVREDMALALSKFGSKAETAVPALINALNDGSAGVRIMAARALTSIDSSQSSLAIPVLSETLTNGSQHDRYWAAVYIYTIDSKNADVIPVFISSLTNEQREIRVSAAYCLRSYGSQVKAAVPALLNMLKARDTEVQKAARAALEKINPEALKNLNIQTDATTP